MAKYKLIVLINAIEGREDEFNDWFTNQHMHDGLKVPGMKTAQRFELTDDQWPEASRQWRYMTLYDVETDDIAGVIAERLPQRRDLVRFLLRVVAIVNGVLAFARAF